MACTTPNDWNLRDCNNQPLRRNASVPTCEQMQTAIELALEGASTGAGVAFRGCSGQLLTSADRLATCNDLQALQLTNDGEY